MQEVQEFAFCKEIDLEETNGVVSIYTRSSQIAVAENCRKCDQMLNF